MCFIPVELRVPPQWNCVFHPDGTVCSIPMELRVSSPWNCVFHPDGTVCLIPMGMFWKCMGELAMWEMRLGSCRLPAAA